MDLKVCSICGFPLKHFWRNADPIKNDICCDRCFTEKVVPAREEKIRKWNAEERLRETLVENKGKVEQVDTGCPTGKIRYKSKVDAEFALYKCGVKQSGNRHEKAVYFCQQCQSFHLTSHDLLPSWKDRNRPGNYVNPGPAKYVPTSRDVDW